MAEFYWIATSSDEPVGLMYEDRGKAWCTTFNDAPAPSAMAMGLVFGGLFESRNRYPEAFQQSLTERSLKALGPVNLEYKQDGGANYRELVAEQLGIQPYRSEPQQEWGDGEIEPASDEIRERLGGMKEFVKARIKGQDRAVDQICDAVIAALLGLKGDPNSPDAVIFLLGPSGVGKTEFVKVLSEFLQDVFGEESYPMLRYDMNDYQEEHTGSRLTGSPPGYVGFDDGGQLTGDLQRNERSVVLLDEIGAAHANVLNVLMTAFDEGYVTPQNPKQPKADCRRTLFFATANYNASQIKTGRSKTGFTSDVYGDDDVNAAAREGFEKHLPPQLRGRVDDVVFFETLDNPTIRDIANGIVAKSLKNAEKYGLNVTLTEDAMNVVANHGRDPLEGARHLKKAVKRLINPLILEIVLRGVDKNGESVILDANADRTGLRVKGLETPERQVA